MRRVRISELMDDPTLDSGEHARALRALNRANRMLGVDRQLYQCLRWVAGEGAPSVLDLGTGGGGFLGYVATRQRGNGACLRFGLDHSTYALQQALRWQGGSLRCIAADSRTLPLADSSVDVVTSSLFLHHFDEADVVAILKEAARVAKKGVVMGDLIRSRVALAATWLGTRLLSRSRVFHVDGPRSTRAAFRPSELAALAVRAGLRGACLERRFPFRVVLLWRKGAS